MAGICGRGAAASACIAWALITCAPFATTLPESGILRWGQFNRCAERFGDWSSLQIRVRILRWCHWLGYASARTEPSIFFTRRTEKATAMGIIESISRAISKGTNEQGEALARYPKDEINAWYQRLAEKQVKHLQAGDILLKMNFTMDAMPVANIISTGQRVLQSYETGGSYATGHVAIALDPLRLAEQTGAGVSINTLGVTDTDVAEHKIDTVYYYVFRCTCRSVREAAAKLAESFTTGSPLPNRGGPLQHEIGGDYALTTALGSVFKPRFAARADLRDKSGEIKLDDWSKNVLEYCTGKTRKRESMFCSAFVLAVYQAACKYVIDDEQIKKGKVGMSYRSLPAGQCLLPLTAHNTTPRTYEQHLRINKLYSEEGVFRYVNLEQENRTRQAVSRIFANLSQAIDNYANFVTTGAFKASGSKTLEADLESLIQRKMEALNAALPSQRSRFQRFLSGGSGGNAKTPSGEQKKKLRKQAIQQMITQDENAKYQQLKQARDRGLAEKYADADLFKVAAMDLYAKSESVAIGGSMLGYFLDNSLQSLKNEGTNVDGILGGGASIRGRRSANRSGRRLSDIDINAALA